MGYCLAKRAGTAVGPNKKTGAGYCSTGRAGIANALSDFHQGKRKITGGPEGAATSATIEGWWEKMILRTKGTAPTKEQQSLTHQLEAFIKEHWPRLCECDECDSMECLQSMVIDFMIK